MSAPTAPEEGELKQRLIAYAHAPVGHAKYKKLPGGDYLMDGGAVDKLAENIVMYALDEFNRIIAAHDQALIQRVREQIADLEVHHIISRKDGLRRELVAKDAVTTILDGLESGK